MTRNAAVRVTSCGLVRGVWLPHLFRVAELGGYGGSQAKVEITVRINHDREVNRARYCPQVRPARACVG